MDKQKAVRYGIIGFGNIGSGTHAPNLTSGRVPNGTLAAICDHDEAVLEKARTKYPDVKHYLSAEELFADPDVDAVIIAVPHYDHPPLAIAALAAGKHVMVEKPAGVYGKQVLAMNEAAEKSGLVFGIMYNQRVNPVFQKVKALIESGQLGGLKRVTWIITTWYRKQAYHDSAAWRSTWKDEGGGTLINQNPHQLDLWQWMFGMPDRIHAFCEFGKYYDIEVEDEVVAYLKYNNGLTGVYITSTGEAPGSNRLEIACDMGTLIVENGTTITFKRNEISEREYNATSNSSFGIPAFWNCEIPVKPENGSGHAAILDNHAQAILKGTPLIAPGVEGIRGLTISNAIHYSAWTGKTADMANFPHDEFYALLQDKIKKSTVKKRVRQTDGDISRSFSQ
ncbi:MAG: Gfo/Idh/MocA family protein [Clostridia bacterium]